MKAVVLLSGGLDSATVAAIAKAQEYELHALSFNYGQRHSVELKAAIRVANDLGILDHRVFPLNMRLLTKSSLVGTSEVPVDRPIEEISEGIPSTYVPSRNIIFLSLASAFAATLETRVIFLGVNQLDYSGYPDCRGEFLSAYEKALNVGTELGLQSPWEIKAPLLNSTKAEIIRMGTDLGVDYSRTVSCYQAVQNEEGKAVACGRCDSCLLRKKGFAEAGIPDPTLYA